MLSITLTCYLFKLYPLCNTVVLLVGRNSIIREPNGCWFIIKRRILGCHHVHFEYFLFHPFIAVRDIFSPFPHICLIFFHHLFFFSPLFCSRLHACIPSTSVIRDNFTFINLTKRVKKLQNKCPTLSFTFRDRGPLGRALFLWRQASSCSCFAHAQWLQRLVAVCFVWMVDATGVSASQLLIATDYRGCTNTFIKHCELRLSSRAALVWPRGSFRRQKWGSSVYKQNAASCYLRWHVRDSCNSNTRPIPPVC